LEEMVEAIRQELLQAEQRKADEAYVEEVLGALVDQASIEYPPVMVEEQLDTMLDDLEERLESQGLNLEDQLKLIGQTEERLREGWRPQAEQAVRRGLVVRELIHEEGLVVDGEEIDERITLLSQGWGEQADDVRQMLSEPERLRSLAGNILTNKAIERLVDIAKGQAPSLEEEEEKADSQGEAGDQAPEETEPVDELESGPED